MTTIESAPAFDDALVRAVSGPVLRTGDPGWAEEVAGFNSAHEHTPEVVVGATSVEDVRAAVEYAAGHGLTVAVQATGHGASAPIQGGLLVSTRRLDSVVVDPVARTARVGAGTKWRAVIDAAAPYGLAPLSGSSSDVGVVGFSLGGGLPVLGRVFGFAADHVRSAEVVTPDGRVQEVDGTSEPDLFWGLRGGKGNLGLVTALTVDLVPVATLYGGGIFYAEEHSPTVLDAYRQWSADLPEQCCTSVAVLRLPPFPDIPEPLRGRTLAHLRVAYVGPADEGARLLAPMRAVAPADVDMVAEMPYTAVDAIHQDPDHPVPAYERSALLRELTADTVATLVEQVGPGVPSPLLLCEVRQLGGALGRAPDEPNAVGGRDAAYSLFGLAVLAGPAAATGPAAVDALAAAVAPWGTGQTLLNLHGRPGDEADRARAWAPDSYRRLVDLRRRYDPAGLLAGGHVITPPAQRRPGTSEEIR
jgi:hypothetical protein